MKKDILDRLVRQISQIDQINIYHYNMGIFQIKYIAKYTIGLNTKNKLNIMKRKKERKKGRKKERKKEEGRGN